MTRRTTNFVEVGQRFGQLVVTNATARKPTASRPLGERAAELHCECGRTTLVTISNLLSNRVVSCGCARDGNGSVLSWDEIIPPDPPVSGSHVMRGGELSEPPRRAAGRQPRHIDTSAFESVMAEALEAYAVDEAYAVAMLNTAITIARKRRTWQVRCELRAAEKEAREQCVRSGRELCMVLDPCSTGACPYAAGDLAEIRPDPPEGKPRHKAPAARTERPCPRPEGAPGKLYTIESAIVPLVELRESRGELPPVHLTTGDSQELYDEQHRAKSREYTARRRDEARTA